MNHPLYKLYDATIAMAGITNVSNPWIDLDGFLLTVISLGFTLRATYKTAQKWLGGEK